VRERSGTGIPGRLPVLRIGTLPGLAPPVHGKLAAGRRERTGPLRVGASVQPHHRRAHGIGHVERAGVRAHRQRRAVQEPRQPPEVVLPRVHHPGVGPPHHLLDDPALRRRLAAHDHRPQAELPFRRLQHPRPALRPPVARLLGGLQRHRQRRPIQPRVERVAGSALLPAESESPLEDRIHAEPVEELEVLLLDVAGAARRQTVGDEETVQIGGPAAVEPHLHGGVQEGRDQSGLQVHLRVQDQIEALVPHPPPQVPQARGGLQSRASPVDREVVHVRVGRHELVRLPPDDPGDPAVGPRPPEGGGDRHAVDHVAHRRQEDQGHRLRVRRRGDGLGGRRAHVEERGLR